MLLCTVLLHLSNIRFGFSLSSVADFSNTGARAPTSPECYSCVPVQKAMTFDMIWTRVINGALNCETYSSFEGVLPITHNVIILYVYCLPDIRFSLVLFYGISTIVGDLMPNPVHTHTRTHTHMLYLYMNNMFILNGFKYWNFNHCLLARLK